jgi:hypothetical protein
MADWIAVVPVEGIASEERFSIGSYLPALS